MSDDFYGRLEMIQAYPRIVSEQYLISQQRQRSEDDKTDGESTPTSKSCDSDKHEDVHRWQGVEHESIFSPVLERPDRRQFERRDGDDDHDAGDFEAGGGSGGTVGWFGVLNGFFSTLRVGGVYR